MQQHRLTPARRAQIDTLMNLLAGKIGAKRPVAVGPLFTLYTRSDYPGLVRVIRDSYGLNNLRVRIRYPEHGRSEGNLAFIELSGRLPPVAMFPIMRPEVTLNLVMSRLRSATFANVVRTLAHELAHPLLWAEHYEFSDSEFAVDLAAMMSGYHDFFLQAHSKEEILGEYGLLDIPETAALKERLVRESLEDEEIFNPNYLTSAEIAYAAEVIRRCVL